MKIPPPPRGLLFYELSTISIRLGGTSGSIRRRCGKRNSMGCRCGKRNLRGDRRWEAMRWCVHVDSALVVPSFPGCVKKIQGRSADWAVARIECVCWRKRNRTMKRQRKEGNRGRRRRFSRPPGAERRWCTLSAEAERFVANLFFRAPRGSLRSDVADEPKGVRPRGVGGKGRLRPCRRGFPNFGILTFEVQWSASPDPAGRELRQRLGSVYLARVEFVFCRS